MARLYAILTVQTLSIFICFDDAFLVPGQYTVFGKVTEGMEYVDKIMRGEPP